MNSLEKILAYQNLKAFLEKKDWLELGQKLDMDDVSLRRTWGKNVEDSFFLIAQTYDTVDNIIAFSEGLSKLTGTPSADGIIILKNGDRLLVEVKASKDSVWKISKGRLDRQKELANKIGIDLFFAVSLKGYWGLFPADYIQSNDYKIEFPRDLKFSLFDSIFNSQLIRIPKGLKIIKYYSPNEKAKALVPIEEPTYGYLYKYQLRYNNILVDLVNEIQLVAITAIEASIYHKYTLDKLSDDVHKVTHECEEDIVTYDFNLVMEPIHRTMSSTTNDYFDSSSFLIHTLDKLQSIGTLGLSQAKQDALRLLLNLKKDGFPFDMVKSSEIDELNYRM